MEYFIKSGWQLNPNEKVVAAITKRIALCNGECPCDNHSEDKHCPCSDYRDKDICHCGLYIKKEESCKSLWIARDIDGWLRLGTSKPVKDKYTKGYWSFGISHIKDFKDNNLYPDLTYDNSPKRLIIC